MIKNLLLLSIGMLFSFLSYSQDFSNKGKDFWIPYPEHINTTSSVMGIYITSDVAASGTITVNGAPIAFSFAANQVVEKFIGGCGTCSGANTFVHLGALPDGIKVGAAIHVVADQPVAVYAHIIFSARSGATLVLPIKVWGKEYIAPSYRNTGTTTGYGEIDVMASVANTTVEITPAKNSRNGARIAGTPYQITLANPGDVYQIQFQSAADLSGTRVKSINCQPIGVFSATTWTGLDCTSASGGDNLFQELFPTSSWGKTFLTAPFKNRNYDIVRIFVNDPTTVVQKTELGVLTTLTGLVTPAAGTGGYYEYRTANPTFINADKAISCAQYITSETCKPGCAQNSTNAACYSDPEMIILSPVEQTINDITVFSAHQNYVPPGQSNVKVCFLNIIIKSAAAASFKINGLLPTGTFTAITGTNYSYLQEDVTPIILANNNPIQTLTADSAFSAIAYGFGDVESYGYNAGTNVKDLYQQISVSTQYGIETSPSVCTGSPFRFKISLPYKPLQLSWDLSNLPGLPASQWNPVQVPDPTCTQYPLPADNTTYICPDSIRSVNSIPIYWFSLPTYYNVATIGSYPIHLIATTSNSDGCGTDQFIDFNLSVSDPPVAAFTHTTPGCVADTVHFSDASITVKPNYHWYWDFGDPGSGALNFSNAQFPVHVYTTPGNKTVRFASITTPGCLSDTIPQTFYVPPQPSATIAGTTNVCLNATSPQITITGVDGTAPYIFSYHINAGPIQTLLSTAGAITVPTTTAGTFVYTLDSVKNSTGSVLCNTHTIGQSATVTVNPLPIAAIAGTVSVCQNGTPPNITFTGANATAPYIFTYTITGPGGTSPTLSVTTTAGNSVTVAAPTGTQGVYTYTLTGVTDGSSTLCSNTAAGTATVTVNQLPTATISGNTELCLNFPAPNITFTGAGGTAPYTFTYTINSGGNQTVTTTAGNSVTVAAPTSTAGTFNYSLVSVRESSSTSCLNNQVGTATVIVDPQPTASFTATAPYCEAKDVTFTPAFSVSTGSVVTWTWDYGDGTGTHTRADGLPFVVNYATPGPKNVTFQTTSDKGCLSAVFAQTVTINPKPLAGFISPEICLLDPFAQFNDTSSVAAPGTINSWEWTFNDPNATAGNPNTSIAHNPTHVYTQVGPYTVELIVTTTAGCKDTIFQGIYISDGNPQAKYNVINPATLCSNDSVGIINKSTIASGNITKLEIYWDYTNQPGVFDTENNPVFDEILKHKYPTLTTAQNYKIHMRAYSGGVCFSSKDTIITVHAAPVAQLTAIPNVCLNNGTVQFTQGSETGGVPGPPGGVYSGAGVSATGLFDPLVAGVGSHTITYTWTSAFGCVDLKTTNVNVLEAPVAIFAPAAVTCQNSSITFTQSSTSTAGVIVTWIWHWGDGSADETYNNGNPRTHTYTTAGPFTATLTVITDYGCKSLPTPVTFTVNPQPHPNFTYTPVACLPQAKIDFNNTTPNISDWVYQWNFDDVNASSINPNTSTATNPSHIYTTLTPQHNVLLTATSVTTSCTHDTTIAIVSIHPAPTASFTTDKQSICTDQTILVTDHSNPADGVFTNWAWDYGDLTAHTTGQVQQPHVYAADGTFIINLTVTNSFGCTDDTTASIRVYPYPVIDAGPDQTVLQGGFINLQATATGNLLTYLWTPGTYLNSTTTLQPTVNPYEDITYKLKVTAEGGCFKTDTVFVKVLKTPLIPNTFTPNGDGIHDTWEIKYLYQYPGNRVQVFTRTGQLVFESHGYSRPWDGTKEGAPLPFDTYYYIIEPVNGRAPITGYVTIVK